MSVRHWTLAAAAWFLAAPVALAQDDDLADDFDDLMEAEDDAVDEVVVTGSRLKRDSTEGVGPSGRPWPDRRARRRSPGRLGLSRRLVWVGSGRRDLWVGPVGLARQAAPVMRSPYTGFGARGRGGASNEDVLL